MNYRWKPEKCFFLRINYLIQIQFVAGDAILTLYFLKLFKAIYIQLVFYISKEMKATWMSLGKTVLACGDGWSLTSSKKKKKERKKKQPEFSTALKSHMFLKRFGVTTTVSYGKSLLERHL